MTEAKSVLVITNADDADKNETTLYFESRSGVLRVTSYIDGESVSQRLVIDKDSAKHFAFVLHRYGFGEI